MKLTIDTERKILLIHGDVSEDQIKSFIAAHDLESFDLKREWPYDQPNCNDILEIMRKSITYERIDEDGSVSHKFRYNTIMPNCL